MRKQFALFQSHLDLAHDYWRRIVVPGDTVIDATCGNGHDTALLAHLALSDKVGRVLAYDVQKEAIAKTQELLYKELPPDYSARVQFIHGCHSQFPDFLEPASVKLIVYNLGYLPGGDKTLTTCRETTISSLEKAKYLIAKSGAISITCYPGHTEGKQEEAAILEWTASLDPRQWSCCHHRWINRQEAPSLLLIQAHN